MKPEKRTYTVSELTELLKESLELTFPEIWIEGEISNLRTPASGHSYFSLKDGKSQIAAVLFKFQSLYLKFRLEEGMKVLARAKVTVYKPRGDLQIVIQYIEKKGLGELYRAFEELKKKLGEEGLFDDERKRKPPFLPRTVGLVTSATGAAVRDFIRAARERNPGVRIIVSPSRVQGEGAAAELMEAVKALAEHGESELIVLARGGGSIEDLWAFNDERLAREIALCPVPVVSAVGHEIDFTIADFAADLRAPTPSAAAEMIIRNRDELEAFVDGLSGRLERGMGRRIADCRIELKEAMENRAFQTLVSAIREYAQRIDDALYRAHIGMLDKITAVRRRDESVRGRLTEREPLKRIMVIKENLKQSGRDLMNAAAGRIESSRHSLALNAEALNRMSPLGVLDRGYSLCRTAGEEVIKDAGQVDLAEIIRITLRKGGLKCKVEEKIDDEEIRKKHKI